MKVVAEEKIKTEEALSLRTKELLREIVCLRRQATRMLRQNEGSRGFAIDLYLAMQNHRERELAEIFYASKNHG